MTDEERRAGAASILAFPVFHFVMNDLERNALDAVVGVLGQSVDAQNQRLHAAAAEVRAIRNIRARLEAISQEGKTTPRNRAPA